MKDSRIMKKCRPRGSIKTNLKMDIKIKGSGKLQQRKKIIS